MASINKIKKTNPGAKPWKAYVNVKGFERTSKRFFSKTEAEEWATAQEKLLREEKKKGDARPDLATLKLKELIDAYLDDPNTQELKDLKGTTKLLAWWTGHYGSTRVLEMGPVTLREARTLLKKGHKNGTVNRHLGALRSVWSWAPMAGYVIGRAWPKKLLLKEPKGRIRFLSDEELAAVKAESLKQSAWMYAALLVAIGCGIRQGELLRLQWSDLDFENKTLTVLISKTDEPRRVHLPDPAVAALKKLRRDGIIGRKHVFVDDDGEPAKNYYLSHRWKKVRKAAGLIDFRFHDLRHTCASYLLQNKASLSEVQSVLGHRSIISTERYAHLEQAKAVTGADKLAEKLS